MRRSQRQRQNSHTGARLPAGLYCDSPSKDRQDREEWKDWLRWDKTTEAMSENASLSDSTWPQSPFESYLLPLSDEPVLEDGSTATPASNYESDLVHLTPLMLSCKDSIPSFLLANQPVESSNFDRQEVVRPSSASESISATGFNAVLRTSAADVERSKTHTQQSQHFWIATGNSQPRCPKAIDKYTQLDNNGTSALTGHSPEATSIPSHQVRHPSMSRESIREPADKAQTLNRPPRRKTSHTVIEKRYRSKLLERTAELRNAVPTLRAVIRSRAGSASEDLEGLTPARKLNKTTIMTKATEYIKHLERRNESMMKDIDRLEACLIAIDQHAFASNVEQGAGFTSPKVA